MEALLQRHGRGRHHVFAGVLRQGFPGGGELPAGVQWRPRRVRAQSAQLRFRLRQKLRSLPRSSFSHRTRFDGNPEAPIPHSKPAQQEEKPVFALPIANGDQRRVFAYLQKRGISAQVIRGFIDSGLLYEDSLHHNCVFVGREASGKPVFASKRGTYDLNGSGFKGDVPGSNKDVAFRLPCDPALDWVAVFEAPIDLMSFCTLHRQVRSNAVALCGLYQGPLDTYLRENPHLKRIVLCLDVDRPRREATKKFQAEYAQKGYDVSTQTPAQGKDWNAYLQQRGQVKDWRL